MPAAVMNAEEIGKLLHEVFPQGFYPGCGLAIERVDYGIARVRRRFQERYIRPGGTMSGPTMMELADFAMYVAVFSYWPPAARCHDKSQHQFSAQAAASRPGCGCPTVESWKASGSR
jgi:acyl-coenzyme A thioesterase PaaI-like protein